MEEAMARTAPEYREAEWTKGEREAAADSGTRPVVEDRTAARAGVTGHNARYVLGISLAAVVVAFALIYAVFWA
jgi:hypothetical protein